MKVKYNGNFPLSSVQRSFTPDSNEEYDLSEADGKYLLNTFPSLFEEIKSTKVETKAEPKVEAKEAKEETTSEEAPKKTVKK